MNAAMDELVEKAARAASVAVVGNEGLYAGWVRPMTAALEAVGLPALLERAEAAERDYVIECRARERDWEARNEARADRDALAAKVARVSELCDIEWMCLTANDDGMDPHSAVPAEHLRKALDTP